VDEIDRWIYLDGAEPEQVRPLLEALRDVEAPTPEDKEQMARALFEQIDATLKSARPADAAAPARSEGAPSILAPGAVQEIAIPPAPRNGPRRAPEAPGVELVTALPDCPAQPCPAQPADAGRSMRAPPELAATAPMELSAAVLAAMGQLPFKPPEQVPPGRRAAKTLHSAVKPRGLGETAGIGDDTLRKAVAVVPFAGSTDVTGIVTIPNLTLLQYASLCTELAVRPPQRRPAILAMYRVTSTPSHRALDEHWREHFVEHPDERATFAAAVEAYAAWLRLQPA
jgi:hypothetical protein